MLTADDRERIFAKLPFSCPPPAAGPLACTSCPNHFMLEGSLCTECLSMQYYDPPTQACKTCHESCRSCSGPGQYSCVTCAFPLHLDRLNNQCVPCCTSDATPEDQSCCHCDKDTGSYRLRVALAGLYGFPSPPRRGFYAVPLLLKLKPEN